jgi:hypothetical protein
MVMIAKALPDGARAMGAHFEAANPHFVKQLHVNDIVTHLARD